MNYTELIISFGDNKKLTLNSHTQEGLSIKETHEKISIKFIGEDPTFYVSQLERFRNRGIVITAKRDNDPRRNLRGALTSLDNEGAIILLGKYPVGLDIDEPVQDEQAPASVDQQFDSSLVSQLLAKLDEQQAVIKEYETKNQAAIAPQSVSEAFSGFTSPNQPAIEIYKEPNTEFSKNSENVIATAEVSEQAEAKSDKPESTKKGSKKA